MPPKKKNQPETDIEVEQDQGATSSDPVQPVDISNPTGDSAVTALAGMFQAFLQYQRDRDERQERKSVQREREYKVLTHQVTQIQMDLEQNRQGASTSERSVTRVLGHMPQLSKLQDTDDIEHFLTTFERLAEVYKWPMEDWAIHLVPLLTGKARAAFVAMSPTYTSDYERVKEAILQKYEINAETYRLRF